MRFTWNYLGNIWVLKRYFTGIFRPLSWYETPMSGETTPASDTKTTAATAAQAALDAAESKRYTAGIDAPLFQHTSDGKVAYIMVHRIDPPLEEGILGKLPSDTTEMDLKKRWGGGTYMVEARTEEHKHIKGGKQRVSIAGDPIFTSKLAQRKYRELMGLENETPAQASGVDGLQMMLTMFKLQADQASATHERNMEMGRQDQLRRDAEHTRAEETRERRAEDDRKRDREHQKGMMELFATKNDKQSGGGMGDMLKLLTVAKDLFAGGDDKDPLTVLAENIPEMIGAVREESASRGQTVSTTGQPPQNPNDVKLTGNSAALAREYFELAGQRGFDAQTAIDAGLAALIQQARRANQQAAAQGTANAPQQPPGRRAGAPANQGAPRRRPPPANTQAPKRGNAPPAQNGSINTAAPANTPTNGASATPAPQKPVEPPPTAAADPATKPAVIT